MFWKRQGCRCVADNGAGRAETVGRVLKSFKYSCDATFKADFATELRIFTISFLYLIGIPFFSAKEVIVGVFPPTRCDNIMFFQS